MGPAADTLSVLRTEHAVDTWSQQCTLVSTAVVQHRVTISVVHVVNAAGTPRGAQRPLMYHKGALRPLCPRNKALRPY